MENAEKTVRTRRIYEGKVLNLRLDTVKLPDGTETVREVVEHRGSAAAVPLLADGRIILIKQYRKPVETSLLEIPAGRLETGESASACARRELEEETGYRAGRLEKLIDYFPSPGYSCESIAIFRAYELEKTQARAEGDEFIEVEIIERKSIAPLIKNGSIKDGKTIAGLLAVLNFT